ncbi:putative mitochondrial protein AtMg00310 [Silene latifolia]|uniref:putative mitochondrial protein AtMg00310 n=1 Tax=Silene latifolia TaxID=37657 RepID=UPI003D76FDA7
MKKINKICKDYFWNIGNGSNRMVFKSWQHICRPSQEGGFNIKELLSWNRALLAKWIWLLSGNDGGIWAAWHRAYVFPIVSIWQMSLKDRFSESLCSIIKVKDAILANVGTPEAGASPGLVGSEREIPGPPGL